MSTSHIPIKPEAQQAYAEFLLDIKKTKKEKWQKCRGQCLFETLEDGSHKCSLCGRKLNANASSSYDVIKENDDDIIDELNLDQSIEYDSDDILPEKEDEIPDEGLD